MADFSIIRINMKSNLLTPQKKLLISSLQYKSHVTKAIFTMKIIALHFPPKCQTGVKSPQKRSELWLYQHYATKPWHEYLFDFVKIHVKTNLSRFHARVLSAGTCVMRICVHARTHVTCTCYPCTQHTEKCISWLITLDVHAHR